MVVGGENVICALYLSILLATDNYQSITFSIFFIGCWLQSLWNEQFCYIVFIRILPHAFSPSQMCYMDIIYIMTLFRCCIGNICLTKMSFLCTVKWGMTFILKCIQDEKFRFNQSLVDKMWSMIYELFNKFQPHIQFYRIYCHSLL